MKIKIIQIKFKQLIGIINYLFDVLNIDYFIKKQQILKKINFHFDKLEHQLILVHLDVRKQHF